MRTGTVTLAICVMLTSGAYSQATYSRFPDKDTALPSPDGRYIARTVDNPQEHKHSIVIEETSTGTKRKVYDFDRSVSVVWSPDSRHFALNDYAGSNLATTYIFATDKSTPGIDVQKEIVSKIASFRNHKWDHDYFGVYRWLDDRRVTVNFWGHGGAPVHAFCKCYVYTLDGSVTTCAKQPHGSDPEAICGQITP